jgi:hypothetical protein
MHRRITPQVGQRIAFGSVTASYTDLLTSVKGRGMILVVTNSLDAETTLSLDGGTTDFLWLPAQTGLTLDLGTNQAEFSGTVSIKYTSGAPTTGAIAAGIIRVL